MLILVLMLMFAMSNIYGRAPRSLIVLYIRILVLILIFTISKSWGAYHPYKSSYRFLLAVELCEDEQYVRDFQYVEFRRFYLTVPRLGQNRVV